MLIEEIGLVSVGQIRRVIEVNCVPEARVTHHTLVTLESIALHAWTIPD
jgi:hypothetical protein